ncbi:MAG: phosphoribosylformylglycinamidine synthase subunit PurQ [Chlamydiota bacterium]|nr:phosphoribosylformylglycinamidine synthase subunit PurQ [Chlamydiota bacterium]
MKKIKALIITGYGINCEKEMAMACKVAGAEPTIMHANEFLSDAEILKKYQFLAFPGGFSFGDELGAGKAFANRLSYSRNSGRINLKEQLQQFVNEGKCIIGICNGFQLLVKLGMIPSHNSIEMTQSVSLAINDSRKFEARWAYHIVNDTPCVFTRGIKKLYLPIRHAEGKLVGRCDETIDRLFENNQVVLQYSDVNGSPTMSYPENPNGSIRSIAGICDNTGRVFGMMAHPEAALYFTNHPHWQRVREEARRKNQQVPNEGEGYQLFRNAISYLEEHL